MKKVTVPFFISHAGCPHRCVFCDQTKIAGESNPLPGEAEILDKIRAYRETSGGKPLEVAYFGGSFTSLPRSSREALLDPLQPLLGTGEVSGIKVSTRPDSIDATVARFLMKRGVRIVELGVQSMDDEVLEFAGRGHGALHVTRAAGFLKKEGIRVGVQLMPGLPGDTERKSLQSLHRVLDLRPDFLRIYPTVVIAGTELERLYKEGRYAPLTRESAVRLCKMMLHRALKAGVPVIRIGLQPTDDLRRDGVVVAGPYHPAFRQIVESDLCLDLLRLLTERLSAPGDALTIECFPSRVSDVMGQRKINIERIMKDFGVVVTEVRRNAELSPFELRVISGKGTTAGNVLRDLNYEVGNV